MWNAGRTVAEYLEDHASKYIEGRHILELGAGGGLPSLVSAIHGAKSVVVTDYPDADLIENLNFNIGQASPLLSQKPITATVRHGILVQAVLEVTLSRATSGEEM